VRCSKAAFVWGELAFGQDRADLVCLCRVVDEPDTLMC